MAYDNEQDENALPAGKNTKRSSSELLPRYFRTPANKKFLSATVDQLTKDGVVEKLNGYVGKKDAIAAKSDDNYIPEIDNERDAYQLDPVFITKDSINNVVYNSDYLDYIGQIKSFRGNTTNHSLLNEQEFYAWNPNIDFDKFSNFREYYWLPNGPQEVPVFGQSVDIQSTYQVSTVIDDDNTAYVFTPNGFTRNPKLKLYRGQTYRFEVNTPGHPISFALSRAYQPGIEAEDSTLITTLYKEGITITPDDTDSLVNRDDFIDEGFIEKGVIEFTIPFNAPDTLYYISQYDINTSGAIQIEDIEAATVIDVENEILGKKTYKTAKGWNFTNGMKVYFIGSVTPAKYAEGLYYVEGVGDRIDLVPAADLEIPAIFTQDTKIPFDTNGFDRVPFGDAKSFASQKDYITINRLASNLNPWSRYNRWFHRDVIVQSAEINNQPTELFDDQRARRPIIEFNGGLRLFNHGVLAKEPVDLIDTYTKDVGSDIEGALGYNIDGVDLIDGMRVLFTGDSDSFYYGKIFTVKFITHNNRTQISLVETDDAESIEDQTVLIRNGDEYSGRMFWYNGSTWNLGQDKTKVNQTPLFDLYDDDGNSIGDETYYDTTNFKGSKVFSYREGEGLVDSELGFPVVYKNITNLGDIVFDFNLLSDKFTYNILNVAQTINSDMLFLKYYDKYTKEFSYKNGWVKADKKSRQFVVRQVFGKDIANAIPVDFFDNSASLEDLELRLYKNGSQLTAYSVYNQNKTRFIDLEQDLEPDDILVIKGHSTAPKNQNGYYETPSNLERNPLNNNIEEFTLGQVNDHVKGLLEEIPGYTGTFPGSGNLRDLGPSAQYGRKFVQHSGSLSLPFYHITDKNANIIKSIRFAKNEYRKFKRVFLQLANQLGFTGSTKKHVDLILEEFQKDKTNKMPFFSSDMAAWGAFNRREFTVVDADNKFYSLSEPFDIAVLSEKSVIIYLNDEQLIYGRDYEFTTEGFVHIKPDIAVDDLIEIYEYQSTEGSYIPVTPTKLGLYPSFEPEIFIDDTYVNPTKVIRGHDGSLTVAYNDYRDDLLLDLEKRIYNNLKVKYNTEIFDIYNYLPGNYRNTNISTDSINNITITDFNDYNSLVNFGDYSSTDIISQGSPFTYNYSKSVSPTGKQLPAFWRNVYIEAYDTDRPHTHPWEMLGFSSKPSWWEDTYGPAPYTADNFILWKDLETGTIKQPGKPPVRNKKFVRPGLLSHLPVDEFGRLRSPLESGYAREFSFQASKNDLFKFGQGSPTETAWRRSSDYPFAILTALTLLRPAEVFGLGYDRSRIVRAADRDLVYSVFNKRLRTQDLVFPRTIVDNSANKTLGLVNLISDYLTNNKSNLYKNMITNIRKMDVQLSAKIGGFAQKEKLKLVLDSRTPLNKGNVFVPDENYSIFLRTSSPIQTVSYSGITIEKTGAGYKILGFDKNNPQFPFYGFQTTQTDPVINVGGISESFIRWTENKQLVAGKIVFYENNYYRVTQNHNTGASFDTSFYSKIAELPTVGGQNAIFRTRFKNTLEYLDYGTVLPDVQSVIDFLFGYDLYLKKIGFVFDFVNNSTGSLENFKLVAKEFLFWTTQNWANGTIINLSPAANKLTFNKDYYVVDNIFDSFYGDAILNGTGNKISNNFVYVERNANTFNLRTKNTDDGIFFITLPLVQTEHAILIDNSTVFNDTIYDPEPGYRQERLKVVGYRTDEWDGSLNIPGFTYDQAEVTEWESWKDYSVGEIVKYKQFYYSAVTSIPGREFFVESDWNILPGTPTSNLSPNWDYRANQFADFYDLDTDNFDAEQQRLAQHLIGYQKREYLANIIQDDVSQYKFYQGFIQDKGTNNALTKLFDKLGSADKDSLEFYEEWAVRTGQYGASDIYKELELQIDESQIRIEPQSFELVDRVDTARTDLIYQYPEKDVYIKPTGYTKEILPVENEYVEFSKTAGYVKLDQIDFISKNPIDVLALDINAANIGDYIWVPNDKQSWNVYKHILADIRVIKVDKTDTGFTATFNKPVDFTRNDIIGFANVDDQLDGFYKPSTIGLNKITFVTNRDISEESIDLSDSTLGIVSVLNPRRFADLNSVNSTLQTYGIDIDNDRIWIDSLTNGLHAVYDNSPVFSLQQEVVNPEGLLGAEFGQSITVNTGNNIMVVGAPELSTRGGAYVYSRLSDSVDYALIQTITPPDNLYDAGAKFGQSVQITKDGLWLFISAPAASNVVSNYVGELDPAGIYSEGDIVSDRGQLWKAKKAINGDQSSINFETDDWESQGVLVADNSGTGSGLNDQGVVHIYKRQQNSTFLLTSTITSPIPQADEKFGINIKSAIAQDLQYKMYVRSSLNNGRLYFIETDVADNDSFRYAKDTRYRGTFFPTSNYIEGEIVFYEYDLYQANTNVFAGGSNPRNSKWELLDQYVDYVGYIPNLGDVLASDSDSVALGNSVQIGRSYDVSANGDVLALTSFDLNSREFRTTVYRLNNDKYQVYENIINPVDDEGFSYKVAVSDDGNYIAISSILADDVGIDNGKVYIYKNVSGQGFALQQEIYCPSGTKNERFGWDLDFSNNRLAVLGVNGTSESITEFDNANTFFDGAATTFVDRVTNNGQVYMFENIDNVFVYAEKMRYTRDISKAVDVNIVLSDNHLLVGLGYAEFGITASGFVIDFRSNRQSTAWTLNSKGEPSVDYDKIKSVFLYDKVTEDLITYLDVIDPIKGKIAGPAQAELSYSLYYDPAVYNVGDTSSDEKAWGREYAGKLWWDLSTVKWYDPFQDDTQYRVNNWNKLVPGFSVDVYEWVESDIPPNEWDEITDTAAGLADGYSGRSKYGSNKYVIAQVFDYVSQSFENKYFFWVKDKKLIPNYEFRKISCVETKNLIQDPAGNGYKFIALLGNDRFALFNSKSLIQNKNTILHVEYKDTDTVDNNVHTEYQLLTEGLATSKPNSQLVRKWIDSLVGYDQQSRQLPDINLSVARRYGILDNPNQSMFVNKTEALKQVIERVNDILKDNLIVDDFDLSPLQKIDPVPSAYSGKYDVEIESENLLRFVGTSKIQRAVLEPVIQDGKILSVNIIDAGRGYTDPVFAAGGRNVRYGPEIEVVGSGNGAVFQSYINNLGQITSVEVIKQGKNYTNDTSLIVRRFTVLVKNDSGIGGFWALYTYNIDAREWFRSDSQAFDTTLYWSYRDWYESGFDETTAINYLIDGSYQLEGLDDRLGDTVRINNVGSGGWLLLKKIDVQENVDYTVNYQTIGRQNGTIQFSSLLYDNNNLGFDNQVYDAVLYDREPTNEIRIILDTIENNIFVDQLEVEWNKLFFASVRYAMSEQVNLDWIFKTSFVTAQHNVGELKQKITFQNDNLENYQDYVNEVKPYSTKVREYISSYEKVDPTNTVVSDFDAPPYYNPVTKKIIPFDPKIANDELFDVDPVVQTYPYKNWIDNLGFEITNIIIHKGGTGWTSDNTVKVVISGGGGPTLEGYATLAGDSINDVVVDTANAKYFSAPNVQFEGAQDEGSEPAIACAILGNSTTRSTHMVVKFDRVTGDYLYTVLDEQQEFTGTGGQFDFALKWPMDLKSTEYRVYIDNIPVLSSAYTPSNKTDTSKGYTRYLGNIHFEEPPAIGSNVRVEYKKSPQLLHAADRINNLYNPGVGMPGKDLGQLMDGIDYDGTLVDSIDFGNAQGFDVGGFGDVPFDTFDNTYDDEIFVLDGSTTSITLSVPLETGVEYNVYKGVQTSNGAISNQVRLDDPNYDGSSVVTNPNAVMATLVGDGITNTILIDNDLIPTKANDVIIVRKSTSDGSFVPGNNIIDVEIGGGNLAYSTARGIDAGDIIVDGDGFVTETTSKGPEEQVPGQVLDTLDMQVFNRVTDGQGIITVQNFKLTDDTSSGFELKNMPLEQNTTFVRVDNDTVDPDAYEIDYKNQLLTFVDSTGLEPGKNLSVITIGTNGSNIIDSDTFIADGVKELFVTNIKFQDNISAFVTINGVVQSTSFNILDEGTFIAFRFGIAPTQGDVITYTLYEGTEQNYSQMYIDKTFTPDGSKIQHKFNPLPFVEKPWSHKILARTGKGFLFSGYNKKYTITTDRQYAIDSWQFDDTTYIRNTDIIVYINGIFTKKSEWTFDPLNGRLLLLNNNVGLPGDTLEIFIIRDADYYFVDTIIKLEDYDVTDIAKDDEIEFKLSDDSTVVSGKVAELSKDNNVTTIKLQGYVRELALLFSKDDTPKIVTANDSSDTQYTILDVEYEESDMLTLAEAPQVGDPVEFYLFSNHDINEFERSTYDVIFQTNYAPQGSPQYIEKNLLASGIIKLRKQLAGSQYAWVIKNNILLVPEVDYILTTGGTRIKLTDRLYDVDRIEVLEFTAPISKPKYGFRIFKDMLNRTVYKRLNNQNQYKLAEPLNYYDINIVLEDATNLVEPNRTIGQPGIIFIDKERIEFYIKDGNVLKQLRRGTLGTGTPEVHPKGTVVTGQGPEETVPYKDQTRVLDFTGDSSTTDFVLDWIPQSVNEFEVFVGGRRLINHDMQVYDHTIDQDSPEADVTIPAEYTIENIIDSETGIINGTILRLTTTPSSGIAIKVVRKIGQTWNDPGKSMSESENQVAKFIRDKTISFTR